MTNIYLSASYTRREEMQGIRDIMREMGHTVTSRWIDEQLEPLAPGNESMIASSECAKRDIEDMMRSTCFIMFTGDAGSKGGRHTEFGFFMSMMGHSSPFPIMELVVVGPRENPFQGFDFVAQFDNWVSLARHMWAKVLENEERNKNLTALLGLGNILGSDAEAYIWTNYKGSNDG